MRIGSALLIIWLIIGAIAGAQRHYYSGNIASCTKASTIVVTILAGPLNYIGVNPKVDCHVPQPSPPTPRATVSTIKTCRTIRSRAEFRLELMADVSR